MIPITNKLQPSRILIEKLPHRTLTGGKIKHVNLT